MYNEYNTFLTGQYCMVCSTADLGLVLNIDISHPVVVITSQLYKSFFEVSVLYRTNQGYACVGYLKPEDLMLTSHTGLFNLRYLKDAREEELEEHYNPENENGNEYTRKLVNDN